MKIVPIVAELPKDAERAATALDISLYYLKLIGEGGEGVIKNIICRPSHGDRAEISAYPAGMNGRIDVARYETLLYFPDDNDLDSSWWTTLKLYGYQEVTLIVTIDDSGER